MTEKKSLQDSLQTSIPIFEFLNFLFQIVRLDLTTIFSLYSDGNKNHDEYSIIFISRDSRLGKFQA